jgi:hypothetical protein
VHYSISLNSGTYSRHVMDPRIKNVERIPVDDVLLL